jgi:hypothetical protein
MLRLLLLIALAIAPLVAAAHSGHHAQEESAPSETVAAPAIPTLVAAPCRGGSHEVCSCHETPCLSPAGHAAVADAPVRQIVFVAPARRLPRGVSALLPPAPPAPFRPRGPPQLS